jgi:uncharacterized protein YndB with AHSA1/START domain
MGRYVLTRQIDAPAARVFRGFTDPDLVVDWMDASAVRDVDGPLDRAGGRYTLVIAGPHRFRSTVVRSDPPRLHETFHQGRLGASARMTATLDEQDGRTTLELLTEYTLPFGALGRWLDRRWVAPTARATAGRELDRLVTLVSATPA